MNDTGGAGAEEAPDAQPPAPGPPARARSLQMGVRRGRKGAFRLHHSTTFFFGVLMQTKRPFSSLQSWILPTRQMGARKGRKVALRVHHSTTSFFWRSHAGETPLFLLEIMDSANFGFRPLNIFFRSIIFFDPLIVTAF